MICALGSQITDRLFRFAPGRHDFFSRTLEFQLESARAAFETSGKGGLQDYFSRLQHYFPGKHTLLDASGFDVLTGANHHAAFEHERTARPWRPGHHGSIVVWPASDHRYYLLVEGVLPPRPPLLIPGYLWVIAAAIGFSYGLAIQFASPLRSLEQVVARFGAGDLTARVRTGRGDEFGKVAAAFNQMAERIETLLTAERRLLQDVSHELRSPLARLEFAIELARTSSDKEHSFERIKKEVDRLSTLVSELLQVTRAETDPDTRNITELSLAELIRNIVDDNAMESEARDCPVRLRADDCLRVFGDSELLRRAVENVLRNALRYAPPGTPVDVALEQRGSRAYISIRDFGPGVPEESLSQLFRPFFRTEVDRNRNSGGGVGLGLSIALRAVRTHEGEMRARNAQPGLLVEIELPTLAAQPSPTLV